MTTPPADLIFRPRIAERLETALRNGDALVLLDAPVGFGKSTALEQFLTTHTLTGWDAVLVEPATNADPQQFWQLVAAAVSDVTGEKLPPDVPAEVSVNQWVVGLNKPTMLVVDAYEKVGTPRISDALVRLLTRNHLLHIVVAGREMFGLNEPLTTARARTNVIGAETLKFSHYEAVVLQRQLTRGRPGAPASDVEANRLLEERMSRTAGWPRALSLAIRPPKPDEMPPPEREECIIAHAYSGQPPGDLCCVACLLAETEGLTTTEIAEALEMPRKRVRGIVKRLIDQGMVRRPDDPTDLYAMCDILKPVVRSLRPPPTEEPARSVLEKHALRLPPEKAAAALELLVRTGNYETADLLTTERMAQLMETAHLAGPILEQVPREQLDKHPLLLSLALATAHTEFAIEQWDARDLAERVLTAVEGKERGTPLENLRLLTAKTGAALATGRWQLAGETAGELDELLATDPATLVWEGSEQAVNADLVLALAGTLLHDFPLVRRAARRALINTSILGLTTEEVQAHAYLAFVSALDFDLTEAEKHLDISRRILEQIPGGAPERASIPYRLAESVYFAWHAQFDEIKTPVDQLRGQIKASEFWPSIAWVEALQIRSQYGSEVAYETLRRRLRDAKNYPETTPSYVALVIEMLASLGAVSGRLAEAQDLLDKTETDSPSLLLAQARIDLFGGKPEKSLEQSLSALEKAGHARTRISLLMNAAMAAYMVGDKDQALVQWYTAWPTIEGNPGLTHLGFLPYTPLLEFAQLMEEGGDSGPLQMVRAIPEHLRTDPVAPLTDMERKVLRAITAKAPLRVVAERLFIGENTLKFHLRNIYKKLEVRGRAQAVTQGKTLGLLPKDPPEEPADGIQ